VYRPEFGRSRSNGTNIIKEIRLKDLTARVSPFKVTKVIGTDTDRSSTYDFLSTFHNLNLSRTVSEINGDSVENRNFFHPVNLTSLLRRFPSESGNDAWAQKLE